MEFIVNHAIIRMLSPNRMSWSAYDKLRLDKAEQPQVERLVGVLHHLLGWGDHLLLKLRKCPPVGWGEHLVGFLML